MSAIQEQNPIYLSRPSFICFVLSIVVFVLHNVPYVHCMSLFVTADLFLISLGFFEIRFATFF